MITQVIEKDGGKEPFDVEKIKRGVLAASRQAGLDEAKQKEVVETVVNKVMKTFQAQTEVKTSEIRDQILNELDLCAPLAADAWRKYEESKKK